jgi:hypothetical protein
MKPKTRILTRYSITKSSGEILNPGWSSKDTSCGRGIVLAGLVHGKEIRNGHSYVKMENLSSYVLSMTTHLHANVNQTPKLCDAVRISDGAFVALKRIQPDEHPHEIEIQRYLCSNGLASEPQNHCAPLYDALHVPTEGGQSTDLLVLPLLFWTKSVPWQTFGEIVDFVRQVIQVTHVRVTHNVD